MSIDDNILLVNTATETDDTLKTDAIAQCSLISLDTISIPIRISTSSHKFCVICRSDLDGKHATVISESIRLTLLVQHTIYLKPGVRCCKDHLNGNGLKPQGLNIIKKKYPPITSIMINDLMDIINELILQVKNSKSDILIQKKVSISFDDPFQYSDDDYFTLIGIYKSDFDALCEQVKMRDTDNRSVSMAIGCLLTKLRIGLSNDVLSTLFSFDDKRTIGHIVESARKALIENFVPSYLGFHHISRETVIKCHTRPLAKQLLTGGNDAAILVLDSTYLYVQKSSNNLLQRKLFSLHKNRPLIKPMMIVATDGYIISAIGPYYADWRNNDANITNHLLRTNQENILSWLKAGDTLVVDRGFRDVIDYVKSLGFKVYMPLFLSKSKKKYT
ncbi:unnamed protein product, partial [Rotaria sp. Silwood2]